MIPCNFNDRINFKALQTDRQTDRQTDTTFLEIPPPLPPGRWGTFTVNIMVW